MALYDCQYTKLTLQISIIINVCTNYRKVNQQNSLQRFTGIN